MLLLLGGCTINYEYTVEGEVVLMEDGNPIGDCTIRLETVNAVYETKTNAEGWFQLKCAFSSPDYDMNRTSCTLKVLSVDSGELNLDVTPKSRPHNGSTDTLRVLIGLTTTK